MNSTDQLATGFASVRAKLKVADSLGRNDHLEGVGLNWSAQMDAGQIDRTQLAPEYSAHLSDEAVKQMSRLLAEYHHGAAPLAAQILRRHASGDQTFCLAKVLFPRGEAASLLFGFNQNGKITGISLMSMAGD
jgi:methylase of polypeptide subunit release factors